MKNKTLITITIFAYICFCFACIKTNPNVNKNPCGELPCPTATGANVVSCYINGKPYIVKGNSPYVGLLSCTEGNTFKLKSLSSGYDLTFFKCTEVENAYRIKFDIIDSLSVKKYHLGIFGQTGCRLDYSGSGTSVLSDSSSTGNFEITALNEHTISGKFDFEIKDSKGNIYKCTNGNFDLSK
jgi:hypothetical protein